MKSSTIVCAIAAASLSFASLSFAQGYERRDRGDDMRHEQRNNMGRDGDHRGFDPRDQRDPRDARDPRDQRHEQRYDPRHDQRGHNGNDSGPRGFDQRGFDPRDQRHDPQGFNQRNERQYGARGPQFYRGGHIPMEYRNRQYVVTNWRDHHLSPPPRGQQWVQVGADYVLIAIATGVIAQLILGQ